MKSGNLNFLEPPGPLQALTGLLYLYLYYMFRASLAHHRGVNLYKTVARPYCHLYYRPPW